MGGGRTTRILLGFGLFCIICIITAFQSLYPSHNVSDSLPQNTQETWPWPGWGFSFNFCKFRQRINVALPDGTGSVRGIRCTNSLVEAFLGIPHAKPPIGALRFNSPKPLETNPSKVFEGSQYGKVCLQQTTHDRPRESMSEDCLTINVFRPRGTSRRDKLPVMVWVYGGAVTTGDTISYNPTGIISQGVNKAHPVIYVSFNYRLNSLGFTASSIVEEAAASGNASLNAGLYDMQSALLWVQRNIEAFGGDKTKVTIFGQSAGAFLIGAFLLADGGEAVSKLNLFRAAIMQSGGPMGVPNRFANQTDALFESLLAASNCSPSSAPLECLRAKSEDEILYASVTSWSQSSLRIPYSLVRDGYFCDDGNSECLGRERVAAVPVIIGNCLDEGTLLAPKTLVDTPGIEGFFKGYVQGQDIKSFLPSLRTALTLYPDDPNQGSPYEPSQASPSDRFYGPRNQYKRIASLLGDSTFQIGRRALLQEYTKRDASYPAYAFLFATHVPGESPVLGVGHGTDLEFIYAGSEALDPTSELGQISIPVLNAWINFAYYLDPNGDGVPPWPKYGRDRRMLRIDSKFKIITDDYREEAIKFLESRNWTTLLDL